jgi:hypothetical protein
MKSTELATTASAFASLDFPDLIARRNVLSSAQGKATALVVIAHVTRVGKVRAAT